MTHVESAPTEVDRLVVGGGIGGLAAALGLARCGQRVHVLEQAHAFEEIGAGIQLAPNALRVLDALGALDAVMVDAVRPPSARLMNAVTGDEITSMSFGDEYARRYGYPYIVTHRSDLLDALLANCVASDLVTLETHKQVVGIEQNDDGVTVRCRDGSAYRARLVIGADGIWSTVRQYVADDGDANYLGDVAYRGAVPLPSVPGRDDIESVTWWIGPGLHLIQYPLRGGALLNQVAVFTADTAPADPQEWGPPEELDRRFENVTGYLREALELVDRSRRWVLRDRNPIDQWTRGRVTVLGDAAHPMAQYLAQGACQALEDAWALALCLAAHPNDLDAALKEYQEERAPRANRVQLWSRKMGEIVHADGVFALVRDELLRRKTPTDYRYVDWLYGYSSPDGSNRPRLTE